MMTAGSPFGPPGLSRENSRRQRSFGPVIAGRVSYSPGRTDRAGLAPAGERPHVPVRPPDSPRVTRELLGHSRISIASHRSGAIGEANELTY
jgi:hypothetical protein